MTRSCDRVTFSYKQCPIIVLKNKQNICKTVNAPPKRLIYRHKNNNFHIKKKKKNTIITHRFNSYTVFCV